MRKTRKSDYIILALMCLITLNIGAIAIGVYSPNKPYDLGDNGFKILNASFGKIKEVLNINEVIKKTINSLFPIAQVLDNNKDTVEVVGPLDEDLEEIDGLSEGEYDTEKDIIIEHLDEYESLIIVKDSDGMNTVENIPEPLMLKKAKVNRENPYILIYHTHATESYLLSKASDYRSSDKNHNMINIGNLITTVLEANGHKVDHVETLHDSPSYNQSYSRSLNTIRGKQGESDNLKILLDIHRDAVLDTNPNIESIKAKSKIAIGGKTVATFSLVVGPDSPNKESVLSFAKYIKAVSDALYPGLCTGITIKPAGKYNQHLSDYSALIEVGYHVNTLEEATEGAKLLGEVLTLVLNSIIE